MTNAILTQARLKELFHYDPDTGIFVRKKTVCATAKEGQVSGYIHTASGYWITCIDYVDYKHHRLAWLYMTGRYPKEWLDHINGDRKDNRFVNLREATKAQNSYNSGIPKTNTSGYKGVYWSGQVSKWFAKIVIQKKQINLGFFTDKEDAHAAYVVAAKRFHGEFYFNKELV